MYTRAHMGVRAGDQARQPERLERQRQIGRTESEKHGDHTVVINDVLEDAQFVAQHLELFRQVEAMVEDVSSVHVGPLVDG